MRTINPKIIAYSLYLSLFAVIATIEYIVIQQPAFYESNSLRPYAVAFDLLIVIPILYYFIIVRRLKQNILNMFFGMSLAITTAHYLLPEAFQYLLSYIEKALVVAELAFVIFIIIRLRNVIQTYRQLNTVESDFILNIKQAFAKHIGQSSLINIFVSELIMLRYGLFFWTGRNKLAQDNEFTIHKKSGFVTLFSVFLFMGIVECLVVHLLLSRYNSLLAWVFTAISVYSLLFLIAHIFSIIDRKITVTPDTIRIKVGMIWNFDIPRDNIKEIQVIKKADKTNKELLDISKLVLASPNVAIILKNNINAYGIYGRSKSINTVCLCIDTHKEFCEYLLKTS